MTQTYKNPLLTVDIIIESENKIVLIERKNPPYGWALPGGFVDYGESVETAALREALEETSLNVTLAEQFQTYSDPSRDSRHHTVSTVFIGSCKGTLKAQDDAANAKWFTEDSLPETLAFDHGKIIADYFRYKKGEAKETIFNLKQLTKD